MISKIKIIIISIVVLIIASLSIYIYIYINNLNKKITELNLVVVSKDDEIQQLNNTVNTLKSNIDYLEKDIDSLHSTLEITSNYTDKVNKTYSDEDVLKQTIYEETISNEEVRDWFSEKLPEDLLDLLNTHSFNSVCNN